MTNGYHHSRERQGAERQAARDHRPDTATEGERPVQAVVAGRTDRDEANSEEQTRDE